MLREIVFRAWHAETQRMFEVDGLSFIHRYITDEAAQNTYKFHDVTLMEYTGLKDTTGKRIFEGDILRVDEDSFGVVKYGVACFYFEDDIDGRVALEDIRVDRYAVVLGNIYENPDILEDRKE